MPLTLLQDPTHLCLAALFVFASAMMTALLYTTPKRTRAELASLPAHELLRLAKETPARDGLNQYSREYLRRMNTARQART